MALWVKLRFPSQIMLISQRLKERFIGTFKMSQVFEKSNLLVVLKHPSRPKHPKFSNQPGSKYFVSNEHFYGVFIHPVGVRVCVRREQWKKRKTYEILKINSFFNHTLNNFAKKNKKHTFTNQNMIACSFSQKLNDFTLDPNSLCECTISNWAQKKLNT